jgi:DNA-binding MarR family transcriptional regulator
MMAPMPRLDASRVLAWRELQSVTAELERLIDGDLRAEWDLPLGWFDVLAALARLGGRARPVELAAALRLQRSSLSRRLDRLQEEGWVARRETVRPDDLRSIDVVLTGRGRRLWRETSIAYRRAVQRHFAGVLSDEEVHGLLATLERIAPSG